MWLYLSIFKALDSAITTSLTKHLTKNVHLVVLSLIQTVFSLPFIFLIILIFFGGIPKVNSLFFILLLSSGLLDTVAVISSTWALKHAPISVLSPLSAFTPVFATLFGFLFLHEVPTVLKLLGVLTIVFGAYCLYISHIKNGFLTPIKKLLTNKGVDLFFITMVIYGITPIFQKKAIFQTQPTVPLFASLIDWIFVSIFLSFFMTKRIKQTHLALKSYSWLFILFGLLNALGQFFAYSAFATTHIGYATALFSLSSLFSVILGGIFFKETELKDKAFGACIMILGTLLIAL